MTDNTMQKNENPQEGEEKSENGDYLIKDDVKQPLESQEKRKVPLIENGELTPLAKAYLLYKQR